MNDITKDDLDEMLKERSEGNYSNEKMSQISKIVDLFFGKAEFSQSSKSKRRMELKSTIIRYGSPSIYLTISPSDIHHILAYTTCAQLHDDNFDIIQYLSKIEDIENEAFRKQQTAENPVSIAEFFHILITAITNFLIGSKNDNNEGIFGELSSYYGMVECQDRGSLHIHLLLWIKGSPNCDVLFEQLVNSEDMQRHLLTYIESIIHTDVLLTDEDLPLSPYINQTDSNYPWQRCSPIPNCHDPSFNENVYLILKQAWKSYQRHIHTFSCFKGKNTERCRYRFPKKQHQISYWDEKSGAFNLKRNEGFTNNLNTFLTMLTYSNTDIQYISSGISGLAITHYITNYISKNSAGLDSQYMLKLLTLQNVKENETSTSQNSNLTAEQSQVQSFLLKLHNNMKKCSRVSANEITTRLLKLPMYYSSHDYVSIPLFSLNESFQPNYNTDMKTLITSLHVYSNRGVESFSCSLDYFYRSTQPPFDPMSMSEFFALLQRVKDKKAIIFQFQKGWRQYFRDLDSLHYIAASISIPFQRTVKTRRATERAARRVFICHVMNKRK